MPFVPTDNTEVFGSPTVMKNVVSECSLGICDPVSVSFDSYPPITYGYRTFGSDVLAGTTSGVTDGEDYVVNEDYVINPKKWCEDTIKSQLDKLIQMAANIQCESIGDDIR